MDCKSKFSVVYRYPNTHIPFYRSFGPSFQRNLRTFKSVCSFPFLDLCYLYASVIGVIGMCLSTIDIVCIIRNGPLLSCSLWRSRFEKCKLISPECERDFKLMSLVLSLEYYTLLVVGIFTENPVMLVPWLVLYMFMIIIEFVIFVLHLFDEGFNISKQGILVSMFLVYNWLSIFCVFFRMVRGCVCSF